MAECKLISKDVKSKDVNSKIFNFNHIWTGRGGKNGPLRAFAKYLKNGLANLHETW